MEDDKIINFAEKKAAGISNANSQKTENVAPLNKVRQISGVTVGLKPKERKINIVQNGKVIEANESDVDVQTTIEVKNPEVEALIDRFTEEKSNENLTALINQLETTRVLVPGKLMDNKIPVPLTVQTNEGDIIQPVFTDKAKLVDAPKSEVIMNLPFMVILTTVLEKGPEIAGIAINPFGKAVIFKRELLEKIVEVVKAKTAAAKAVQAVPGGVKTEEVVNEDGTVERKLKLTEEQYTLFERSRFEVAFLPQKLYEEGQALIDRISEGRETCIDELFEESFTEKRMYPYLANEFKVMVMSVSDNQDIVTITMPTRDMAPGIAEAIYMSWDKESQKGRYFTIIMGKNKKDREAVEIVKGEQPKFLGAAPDEGTEINWFMTKLNESDNLGED